MQAWAGRRVLVLTPTPTHPIDFGNRKRVHRICRRLKDLNAEVHLLHYASETDWRIGYPIEQLRQMSMTWDSYSTIFPTRPIHPPPQNGSDHEIDEWWDPAIGQALSWMFSHDAFDAFIVNYTWLSKALEFAPRHTLRILDTHDRFSGRREMLQAHGIAPEFFHVAVDSERIALDRADVVWAIKEHEAEYFSQLTRRQVVVMPHADRRRTIERATPAEDGLTLGIVGARNSINQTNIRQFVRIAAPIFRRWLAPLTVRIAGSVCDLLPDDLGAHFELVGPVDDLDNFYNSIDAAIVPMSFSTGLKIKVSEALALGLPVISHAHAFEGFKGCHPAQVLPDFEQIAYTCVDLAYDRSKLGEMAAAARRSQSALEATVSAGFGRTGAIIASFRPRLLVLVSADSVQEDDRLAAMWLASCLPFLSAAANVTLLVSGGDPAVVSQVGVKVRGYGVTVMNYPAMGTPPAERADRLSDVIDMARQAALTFLIDDAIADMPALPLADMHLCIVLDVLGFGAASAIHGRCRETAIKAGRVTVFGSDRLTPEHLRLVEAAPIAPTRRGFGLVPLFSEKYLNRLHRLDRNSGALENVVIFSPDARSDVIANGLEQLLATLHPSLRIVIVRRGALRDQERCPQDFLRDWLSGFRVDLVVDLAPGAPYTAALRELAHRRGAVFVDRLTFSSVENYTSETGCSGVAERLLHVLSTAANGMDPVYGRTEYDNEAGWAWLWRFISELPASAEAT